MSRLEPHLPTIFPEGTLELWSGLSSIRIRRVAGLDWTSPCWLGDRINSTGRWAVCRVCRAVGST